MTHRMGSQGRVVIPKALRTAVGLAPGDEVTFVREGHGVLVQRVATPDALLGCLRGHRLVAALAAERRIERRR